MKRLISLSALTAALSVILPSAYAAVSDGTIEITGEVLDNACVVNGGKALEVNLGKYYLKMVNSKNGTQTFAKQTFEIPLTRCPEIKGAQLKFTGTTIEGSNTTLALSAADEGETAATNIGVRLYNPDGSTLKIDEASKTFDLAAGTNTLKFQASYFKRGNNAVTAGAANTTAKVVMIYP